MKPPKQSAGVMCREINFGKDRKEALRQPGIINLRKTLRCSTLVYLKTEDGKHRWGIMTADGDTFIGDITDGIKSGEKWLSYPAKWWQFWYPGSGIPGGLVFTFLLVTMFWLITFLYGYITK